jgi:hypothetical protein
MCSRPEACCFFNIFIQANSLAACFALPERCARIAPG